MTRFEQDFNEMFPSPEDRRVINDPEAIRAATDKDCRQFNRPEDEPKTYTVVNGEIKQLGGEARATANRRGCCE